MQPARVYLDSSAILKRVFWEPESSALEEALATWVSEGTSLVASTLAWVEVSRAVRRHAVDQAATTAVETALSGLHPRPVADDVVSLARHLGPDHLRTLDAIHLATAVLLTVDAIVAYDERLRQACRYNGFELVAPGR